MARTYQEMTKDELLREQESLLARYKDFQAKGLQLDMSRGKPCKEQLDLSVGMNDVKEYVSGGVDVRNYGILDGIASCKQLFAELLEVPAENVIIGPNESLTLMFDFICQSFFNLHKLSKQIISLFRFLIFIEKTCKRKFCT